ncbi:aminomethyltransferase [uncultured bacterium]|nr:aminomethyltransferase [uncultured bacterium]
MLKKTPLHALHLTLNAKMVAFAGYEMPIQYKGIIYEHLHCREFVGFFDISHMGQCLLLGNNAAEELERLTPSAIQSLKIGEQKYTVLLNEHGGIIDDIIITRQAKGFMLVLNAACKTKDIAHLKQHCQSELIELNDYALFALQGCLAENIIKKYSNAAAQLKFMQCCDTEINGIPCNVSRSGYTGEDGFEISVANQYAETLASLLLAEENVKPIGLGARDTLRLEAGLCLYGHELNEDITPVEAGLSWLYRKTEVIKPATRRRVGLLVDSKIPVREHTELFNAEDELVGVVTSGSFSPCLKQPIAMALINNDYTSLGTRVFAMVRNTKIALTVTALPFVAHRYRR